MTARSTASVACLYDVHALSVAERSSARSVGSSSSATFPGSVRDGVAGAAAWLSLQSCKTRWSRAPPSVRPSRRLEHPAAQTNRGQEVADGEAVPPAVLKVDPGCALRREDERKGLVEPAIEPGRTGRCHACVAVRPSRC